LCSPAQSEQALGFGDHLGLRPIWITYVKQLVDQVLGGQAAGVVDRRLFASVVGDDPDEAVAHGAGLVADGERGDALELDPVAIKAEAKLPAHEAAVEPGSVFARCIKGGVDNASHSKCFVRHQIGEWVPVRPQP
jgi:hypothetical protein